MPETALQLPGRGTVFATIPYGFATRNARRRLAVSTPDRHTKERRIMFEVTERAGEILRMLLARTDIEEDQCMRLDLASAQIGLRIDREQVGDETVTYEGTKVLALDPYTAEECASRTLDCDGHRFILLGGRLW